MTHRSTSTPRSPDRRRRNGALRPVKEATPTTDTALPLSMRWDTLDRCPGHVGSGSPRGRCLCAWTLDPPSTPAPHSASCALPAARPGRARRGRVCPIAATPALSSVLAETAAPRRKRQRELGGAATGVLLVRERGSLRLRRRGARLGHCRPVACLSDRRGLTSAFASVRRSECRARSRRAPHGH